MTTVSKTIQIRDVPDDVHAELRARAARAGQSLSDYLREGIEEIADRPAIADVLRRARRRTSGPSVETIVEIIRSGREERATAILEAAMGLSTEDPDEIPETPETR
jgi:antitoxin FitA